MADLAVAESARRLAMDDQPDADAGADGHIGEIVEAASAAPADFGERRTIDVGVETARNGNSRFERPAQLGALPIGLVRRADLAIVALFGIVPDQTYGGDDASATAARTRPALMTRHDHQRRFQRSRCS